MKSAKTATAETAPSRRSQPARQARTNPSRTSLVPQRSASSRDPLTSAPGHDQPIDVFPAITHFADAITALPKELVRHFTLLKEVDAKIFSPEETLFKLVHNCLHAPFPKTRLLSNDASSATAVGSAPMSTQNSSSGIVMNNNLQPVPFTDEAYNAAVFDQSNTERRRMFLGAAAHIKEMLVALEEKNHVISAANDALDRQLARVEDVWPHLENEFSPEAKWGSTTHWAYSENRAGKASHNERPRRDGMTHTISAAAQLLVDEAAARSESRKQAVQAKKNLKNNPPESDFDDPEARNKLEGSKKAQSGSKIRKPAEVGTAVGLGISSSANSNGNPPPKRRKVDKSASAPAATERAMSTVFGNNVPKPKAASPRETPAPDAAKKRKALPSGAPQPKKSRNGVGGMSPSITSSPVLDAFSDPKAAGRSSPAPVAARPVSSRARQNSTHGGENGKARPSSSSSNKPNGILPATPDLASSINWSKPTTEAKPSKEPGGLSKQEAPKCEADALDNRNTAVPSVKKDTTKNEDPDRRSESMPAVHSTVLTTVTTKSGRASKPSTPALATFQEAARSRAARNAETTSKRKKSNATAQALAAQAASEDAHNGAQGADEGEIDADEPTYCYCNSVSYGSMIACDADGCEREWFHLECVGLKVPPKQNVKWYCEDCKERLKAGGKKVNGR